LVAAFPIFAQNISLKSNLQKGDFPLVSQNYTVEIFISADDYKLVQIAAQDFASDVEEVAGLKRELVGARGFEPPTLRSRTARATKLRYAPSKDANANAIPRSNQAMNFSRIRRLGTAAHAPERTHNE
jgi:hypothetical protein